MMAGEERQHAIWQMLQSAGSVRVNELADEFAVTPETIRRDLSALERTRLVRRVHGGAVLAQRLVFEAPLEDRTQHRAEEKRRIAIAACEELPAAGAIFLDSGSTVAKLAESLPQDTDLLAVTNSIPTVLTLASWPRVTAMTVGGRVRSETLAEVDDWALRSLRDLRVDVAFIAANAVSTDGGLSTPDAAEAAAKRAMFGAARRTVVLVDHTKFETESLLTFGHLRDVDTVITGQELDAPTAAAVRDHGVRLVLA